MKSESFAVNSYYFLNNTQRWIGRVFSFHYQGLGFTSTLEAVVTTPEGTSVYFARVDEPLFVLDQERTSDTNTPKFNVTAYWD